MWQITSSVGAYVALSVAMYFALRVSVLLTLALAPLTGGFLVRTFIGFHDCAHGSLFRSKRLNSRIGAGLGLLVLAPFRRWAHDHAVHHATAGDLDRRGVGDLPTMTVSEYFAQPPRKRLAYRIVRNPLVMFGFGPVVAMIIGPRIFTRAQRPRMRRSVLWTDAALLLAVGALCWLIGPARFLIAGLCWLLGWRAYLMIELPTIMLAGAVGIWLFYVQHQFEDAYWRTGEEWSYADAALRGSSFLKLPRVLQYFSGNIGYHHVHHLNARIPNYNLQRAHEENSLFGDVPVLTLADGLRAVRLNLWDEERGRLVGFKDARR